MARAVVVVFVALVAGCVDDGEGAAASVNWEALQNPVFGLDDVAVKDACAWRDVDGRWRLAFSHISDDPFRFRLGFASSEDFADVVVDDVVDDEEVGGLASPTVVARRGGGYVMTFNSHTHDTGVAQEKLYARVSDDGVAFGDAGRLVVEGADEEEDRLIDAALAFADVGTFLFFKREQTATVAFHADDDVFAPYMLMGALEPGNLENLQPIEIDGVWHLVGTSLPIDHRAMLLRLDGDADDPQSWTTFTEVRELVVAGEAWNTGTYPSFERSNAAFVVDNRADDGFFYLLYAGSTELGTFEGRGHARLGLARSLDLVDWAVPPR